MAAEGAEVAFIRESCECLPGRVACKLACKARLGTASWQLRRPSGPVPVSHPDITNIRYRTFGYSKVLAAWKLVGKFLAKGSWLSRARLDPELAWSTGGQPKDWWQADSRVQRLFPATAVGSSNNVVLKLCM